MQGFIAGASGRFAKGAPISSDVSDGGDPRGWEATSETFDAAALTALVFECELIVKNTFLDIGDFGTNSRGCGSFRRSRSAGSEPSRGSLPIDKGWHTPSTVAGVSCCSRSSGSSDVADEDIEISSLHNVADVISADVDDSIISIFQNRTRSRPAWADLLEDDEDVDVLRDVWANVKLEKNVLSPMEVCSKQAVGSRPSRPVNRRIGARERSNIFVSNIPKSCSEEEVRAAFSRFGSIASASIARDGRGCSKCHGNVSFVEADAALAAVARCEQGRLTLSDSAGKKCQLGACWAEVVSQAQQGPGQHQQVGDKGARRRRKKDLQESDARAHVSGTGDAARTFCQFSRESMPDAVSFAFHT